MTAASTPLTTSTLPRDLLDRPAKTPTVNRDDSALASLSITNRKLKELEAEIAEDAAQLGTLKDAINKSEQISIRLVNLFIIIISFISYKY